MIVNKDIIKDNNPLLRKKSSEVVFPLKKEDIKIIESLIEYLNNSQDEEIAAKYDLTPGVGIAAPQIGILKKIFVMKVVDDETLYHYALVNPKILSHSIMNCYLKNGEGCLSVPETHIGYVKRHYKVKFKAYDYLSKKDVTIQLKGYPAIVFQHEYDHLQGVLYYDHINDKKPLEPLDNSIEI